MNYIGQHAISSLPVPDVTEVPEAVSKLWKKAEANLGFVPNVFRAQAINGEQFLAWWNYFNLLLNKEGFLSLTERELVAVVVSNINSCLYCAVSHGAALRELMGDTQKADSIAVNYRHANLTDRQRALAEYTQKLTLRPAEITADDLIPLRHVGLDDHQIMELVQVIGMFNMTNRVSSALGLLPNAQYYTHGR